MVEVPGQRAGAEIVLVAPVPTLVMEPTAVPIICGIGVTNLYKIIMSQRWYMPSPFREGSEGARIWGVKERPQEGKREDIRKIYEGLRHPAVPRWMSDRVYLAATRREFGGVKFGVQGGRRRCPKCGQDLTCEHKYARCPVTQRVWGGHA